jgi:hypothetical protein
MLRLINFLLRTLRSLKRRLKGDKGKTSHKNWLKGYNEWKNSYK